MGQEQKRNVGPLSLRASFRPGSVSEERRTVDLVWSTGAKVLRSSYYDGASWEELSLDPKHVRMGRLNNGAPFLRDHNGHTVNAVLGVVESARLESGEGIATIRFAKAEDDPEADKVFRKIKDGILQNVSVGYRTYRSEKIEGGDAKIPTFRATDWEPYEISAVAMGADDDAGFRSADNQTQNECVFVTRGVQRMDEEAKKAAAVKAAEDQRTAEVEAAREAATKAERERVSGIRSAVRSANLGDAFGDELIAKGVALDKAREAVLNEMATRSEAFKTEGHISADAVANPARRSAGGSGIQVGEADRDKFVRGVSAWLFEKSGNGLVKLAKKRGLEEFKNEELDGGEFRGMSLVDVARACCERAGISTRGIYDRAKLIDLASRASTGDFAVLFENVMRKSMRAAYATQEDTWRRFCGTETVQDFKQSHRYLNGSFGTLPVVDEDEEYRNVAVPDGSKLSISTETRGGIIRLSRQALINDDMGALADLAVRFGRSAGRSIEAAVYAELAKNSGLGPTMSDSQPYFHSNRANVSTSAALSVAALDADRVKMRAQKDPNDNDFLDLNPRILLIPVGLESAARVLNESAYDHTTTDAQKPNAVRGLFSDIVSSPRLTASTTRRYLFTEGKEAFKVVFLEGSGEGPTMESQEGFRSDGTEWKCRIDFKVNPYDPKTAVTNAGT